MVEPLISIIAPSIRTHFWMMQYYSLIRNDIPIEVIYAGPNKPNFDLPAGNMRFIYTDEDPVICCHKAIKISRGEYIYVSGDDSTYPERAFDKMVQRLKEKDKPYIIFPTCQFRITRIKDGSLKSLWKCDNVHLRWFGPRYIKHKKDFCPYHPPQGCMIKKSVYYNMGGFDRRLRYRCYHWDLAYRSYECGIGIEACEDIVAEEVRFGGLNEASILNVDLEEEKIFFALWCKDDDKPERYTPYNVDFIKTFEDLDYWKETRCKEGKLTILTTRSDKVETIDENTC